MKKYRARDRFNYQMDLIMSKGTISLILGLAVITCIITIIAGLTIVLLEKSWANGSVFLAVWKSFTLTLDPGNLAGVSGSVGLVIVTAIVTLSGIFITSTLIGIINAGLSGRLENLRKGNAKILEKGHTIILGFNESTFSILSELQIANENVRKACIVVLGKEDKQFIEEQIIRRIPLSHNTRIICRSGDITSTFDLARCSIETCKSIIVNQTDDATVIRVILAASNYLKKDSIRNEYPESQKIHISASINEYENLQVAKIAGQGFAEVLYFNQVIARIMANVCYQSGLSAVYVELLDFSGDEIYIESFPDLTGMSFHDCCMCFRKSTIIGFSRGELIHLNPSQDEIIQQNDKLILIALDDGISIPSEQKRQFQTDAFAIKNENSETVEPQERLLILGTNNLLFDILSELNDCLPCHSHVTIANDITEFLQTLDQTINACVNLSVELKQTNINRRDSLEQLMDGNYTHILILSDTNESSDYADAKTLTILLHIRDIALKHNLFFGITSQMLDVRNQALAQGTNVSDFVISSNISSLMLTQISENRKLAPIILDLLDSAGSEIYMKPSSFYIKSGIEIDIFSVVHAVALKNEIFIGYKRIFTDPNGEAQQLIVTNPDKNEMISFSNNDCLIVIA